MTSNDVITIELFNSKMETIITQIQLGNERLRNDLTRKIDGVHNELTGKIDGVRNELNTRIDKLEARIDVVDARLTGIENRLDDVKTFMSIGFSIVAVIVALMVIAPTIADFFRSLRKPSITLEEVRKLVREEIIASQEKNALR